MAEAEAERPPRAQRWHHNVTKVIQRNIFAARLLCEEKCLVIEGSRQDRARVIQCGDVA